MTLFFSLALDERARLSRTHHLSLYFRVLGAFRPRTLWYNYAHINIFYASDYSSLIFFYDQFEQWYIFLPIFHVLFWDFNIFLVLIVETQKFRTNNFVCQWGNVGCEFWVLNLRISCLFLEKKIFESLFNFECIWKNG